MHHEAETRHGKLKQVPVKLIHMLSFQGMSCFWYLEGRELQVLQGELLIMTVDEDAALDPSRPMNWATKGMRLCQVMARRGHGLMLRDGV